MPNFQANPADGSTTPKVAGEPYIYTPLANCQIQVTGVVTLASGVDANNNPVAIPTGAIYATITVEGANVRWTDNGQNPVMSGGSAPSGTFGSLLSAGQDLPYSGNLSALKFAGLAGAVLDVAFYR